jgi:hypothetical protein
MENFLFKRYAVIHAFIILTLFTCLILPFGLIFPDAVNKIFDKLIKG